jgi:hypothetical protein
MRDWPLIIAALLVMVALGAGTLAWQIGKEDSAPVVETPSVRCEAALGLREATVEAGVIARTGGIGGGRDGYTAGGGRLPRDEYDRLLSQAGKEIRLFC